MEAMRSTVIGPEERFPPAEHHRSLGQLLGKPKSWPISVVFSILSMETESALLEEIAPPRPMTVSFSGGAPASGAPPLGRSLEGFVEESLGRGPPLPAFLTEQLSLVKHGGDEIYGQREEDFLQQSTTEAGPTLGKTKELAHFCGVLDSVDGDRIGSAGGNRSSQAYDRKFFRGAPASGAPPLGVA